MNKNIGPLKTETETETLNRSIRKTETQHLTNTFMRQKLHALCNKNRKKKTLKRMLKTKEETETLATTAPSTARDEKNRTKKSTKKNEQRDYDYYFENPFEHECLVLHSVML